MQKAILTVNGEDLIVKYDHDTKMISLIGKGIDLQFKAYHFDLVKNTIATLECHAIQEAYDKKYGTP
jgi:hypothetical protein